MGQGGSRGLFRLLRILNRNGKYRFINWLIWFRICAMTLIFDEVRSQNTGKRWWSFVSSISNF
jgi:hypothetical protein